MVWRVHDDRPTSRLLRTTGLVLAALLLASCGGNDDTPTSDDDSSPSPTASASVSPSVSDSASSPATASASTTTAPAGECSPPTTDVTYSSGTARLFISNGPDAGTYELSTEPEKTEESSYKTGFGEQFIGNWRGTLEEELPALELRMLNQGDVCNGPPIVRVYLFGLAYEDNDSMRCGAKLETLTATAVSGGFACAGIPRTFGTREPDALDATGTFSLSR